MSKMAKIALVGLLATQGCYRAHELHLLNPQESAKQLEKDLKEYHLVHAFPPGEINGKGVAIPASITIRKGNRNDSISIWDLDGDGQVDAIFPAPNGPFRIEEYAPKAREVFQRVYRGHQEIQKAYRNHQASQRNYKK